MIHLAVHYNNLGVDILSSRTAESNRTQNSETSNLTNLSYRIDRDTNSRKSCPKRRKIVDYHQRVKEETQKKTEREFETEEKVNKALACFQKALSLIVQTTEHHRYHGNGLKYHPNDSDGFLRYENEAMGKQLVSSVNPRDTNIKLKGDEDCSNEYIYWKAIKIGEGNEYSIQKHTLDENDGTSHASDFTRALNEQDEEQRHSRDNQCNDINLHQDPFHHSQNTYQQRISPKSGHHQPPTGGYESLTKSIFHSMICIYNIALCYQYKGMITKARQLALLSRGVASNQTHYHSLWGFGGLFGAAEFFLDAAVDHYTQAYELMTRFRLEDSSQYTLLMAMMNNLAATYGSLCEPKKAEICNRYLVRSLILVICSSERDGHLGQEVLSRRRHNEDETKGGILSKEEDRTTFESFLANVTYLMMGGDDRHSGNTTAAAA